MKMPASEIADRFTILLLKVGHGAPATEEVTAYARACDEDGLRTLPGGMELLTELFMHNAAIWQLETQVRQGKEGELGLEEVGRRALAIRDLNAKRIAAKNRIAELTNGFREVKIAHASEETHG
jgi:hypothetical protein